MEVPIFLITSRIRKFVEKTNGRKTIIVVSVDAKIDRHTSEVPCFTETSLLLPEPASRYIFSSTTTELSTSMPIARAKPTRVRLLIVMSAA